MWYVCDVLYAVLYVCVIDICLLPCVYLWQISQIQTCFVLLSDLDLSLHDLLL